MAKFDVEIVSPTGDICGESAVWDSIFGTIYWFDISRFLIHRFSPHKATTCSWFFDEAVVVLSFTSGVDKLLVVLGSKLIWWWPEKDKREDHGFLPPEWPDVRLNDGRADPLGNFWIGSMGNNVGPNGSVRDVALDRDKFYRITPDGNETAWARGVSISNTLCGSPDHTRFYFGNTLSNTIKAYRFDAKIGDIAPLGPHFAGSARGLPNGSAINSEGYIWKCHFFGGCITRISLKGELLEAIKLPIQDITTTVFGGDNLKTLYVTSASDQKAPGDRLARSLLALRTSVAGVAVDKIQVQPYQSRM